MISPTVRRPHVAHSSPSSPPAQRQMRVSRRAYHESVSARSLNGMSSPENTLVNRLGVSSLNQIRELPGVIRRGVAVEHALRKQNRYYMVQSTPKCMAFLGDMLTALRQGQDAPPALPYMQLRHNPVEGSVNEVMNKVSANGGNDLSPQNRAVLLSGTFGLFHNITKDESPLSYLIENRAATSSATLKKIGQGTFEKACSDFGFSEDEIEKLSKKFIGIFNKHMEMESPTLLYINFKPEDADEVGYHALPFGAPHPKQRLSEVMPQVMHAPEECKEHFCPENGSPQQMRFVATRANLDPKRISVINVSNPAHLKHLGADEILRTNPLPKKLERLIGKVAFSASERKEQRSFALLQNEVTHLKRELSNPKL